MKGRYVGIRLVGSNRILHICEVHVFLGVNVALGKTAFQTSTYGGAVASLAVDGNTDTNFIAGSCSRTAGHLETQATSNPTWWVDLGQSYVVDRVVIFNRGEDCCAEWLNPFNIYIGHSDQVSTNPRCDGQIDVNLPSISVSCEGKRGRYVGIQLPGPSRILSLCEVQIFRGTCSPCQNDAACTDDDIEGPICTCTAPWEEEICNQTAAVRDIDECVSSPCRNGAVCLDRFNGYLCQCPPGYKGLHCETDVPDSDLYPCPTQPPTCTLQTPLIPGVTPVHRCDIQTGIEERIRRVTDPLTVLRKADIVLHGEALLVSCVDMSVTGYSWEIFQRSPNPNHVNVFSPVDGFRNLTTNRRDLTVPKQTLLPGTYLVQFQVTIVDELLSITTDFVHQTWIQVVTLPLVTTLGPSLVTQYTQGDFWVNAEASWDPDGLVPTSELHFNWTCETSDGYNCDDISAVVSDSRPGARHYRTSQSPGTTFSFTVEASSPGRSSIQASQLVVFQDNRACGLAIGCISNCDWSNTNPSEHLVIEAIPGASDTPLYEWSVLEHPGDFGGLHITSREPNVVIASNTFHVVGNYSLRVVNHNQVCSDGLAVSEWTFRVLDTPALRDETLSTPCVLERAGAGGCVCCGEFVHDLGHLVTYKFRRIPSVDALEKARVRYPQDEPFLEMSLSLTPYISQVPWYCSRFFPPTEFIMEVEVMSVDGRVSALNITVETADIEVVILEIIDGLSQTKVLDVDDVMDLTSLLAMGAAEPEKLSKNLTLLIARGLQLSAEALRMIVENNTNDDIPVKDINAVSANIFTGFTILLEATATSAWTAESNLQEEEAIEVNNGTASAAFKGISHIFHMYYTLPPDNGTATLEMSVLHAKVHKEVCEIAQKKVFTVNDTFSIVPAFVAQKKVFTVNDTLFVVPAFNTLFANGCEEADSFGVGVINSDFNPFRYSENSPDVGSEVVGLTVWRGRDRQPVHHLPKPVDMIISRDKQRTTSSVYKHTGRIRSWDDIAVVPFRPQRARTALTILLDITSTSHSDLDMPHMQLVWQKASAPTTDSFKAANWTTVLPVPQAQLYTLQLPHTYNNTNLTSNPYSWLLPSEALSVSEWDIQINMTFYLGVKYAAEDTSVPVKTTFTVSVLETACVYFGENSSHLWEGDGCKVGPLSNTTHLHCRCDHLTKFAGFVPPNPINFDVALSANIAENPMGLIAVLSVFGLFLLGCLMARKADRIDLTKVGVSTPTGHKLSPNPDYHYIVTVYTGFRLDVGTTAQVSLTVFGLQNESEPLALRDDRRLLFGGGSVDSFLVSSEEWLGPLTHVHVWHDNAGSSPGWYLNKVVIQHVCSGRVDYFICNRWLALDEDDGRIDRMVFVASPEEIAELSNLISERATKDFHDGHLFYSLVGRPARSPFTRAQRLACCMSTVYSAMLANIMFFGQGDKFDPPEPIRIMGVEIEPPISLPEIMIAIESAVIVFPINALIVLLYRNAAPKPSSAPTRRLADTKDVKPRQDTGKGRGCLPWWTATVAGLLAFAVSFVAAFFTVLYTLSFGHDKAKAWLTAFLASFVTDMILIQPVKVLVAAVVLGLLIRKPTTEDDPSPTEPTGDEEYLQIVAEQEAPRGPPVGKDLARDRAHRIRRKMWRCTLKEIVIYGTFLSVLMVMSYTERSSLAFHMDNSVRRAVEGGDSFSKISDPASYWTWLEQDVLPAVHCPAWYNGRSCEDSLTLPEHLTHAISPLQLRQVRTSQEQDCTIPDAMTPVVVGCLDEYSTGDMDTGSYSGSWGVATNNVNTDHDNSAIPSPWDFTYGDINNGFLYVGEHGVYSGGGYTAALGKTLNASLQTLAHLRSNNWLDNRTRAVFMETVLYNPHANLFAVVTMTTEFSITGHVSMATELVIFRIHHDGQVLLLVLRMVLMILLLFSLVREVLRFNTYVIAYLTDPWSWLEILTITTGMATMGLYFRAQSTTDEVSGQEGRVTFHLYRSAAMWYQVYTYLLGTLTCCTLVKFIRLLKFNKHVNALLYTMKKTARPLINFFVMSGIVFTAFALAANLIFGITVPGYISMLGTYMSLFNMMLGSFPFAVLKESSPIWGPAIFLSFQCTMQFILLSMFMTIVMDVYMAVKGDDLEDVGMMGFLWEEVRGVAHKMKVTANRPNMQPPADRERQFTQLDQMHELLEELDRKEKSREKEEKSREKEEKRREKEEKRREERNREERNRMVRYSENPSLWFV
ncbi:uncharacterized protein LOC144871881 [Branchiostoma floridae x Branchiostoma japonicum]